jgi:hypothetical protein
MSGCESRGAWDACRDQVLRAFAFDTFVVSHHVSMCVLMFVTLVARDCAYGVQRVRYTKGPGARRYKSANQ